MGSCPYQPSALPFHRQCQPMAVDVWCAPALLWFCVAFVNGGEGSHCCLLQIKRKKVMYPFLVFGHFVVFCSIVVLFFSDCGGCYVFWLVFYLGA
jgi:hypothetical protein